MKMRNAFSGKRFSILLVVGFAIVLALPMLLYGPLIDGHDTHEHLNYVKHFSEQFWTGNLSSLAYGHECWPGKPDFFRVSAFTCVCIGDARASRAPAAFR